MLEQPDAPSAAPAIRNRLIVNMLQGKVQQDNAYSRLDGYLAEFETGLGLA